MAKQIFSAFRELLSLSDFAKVQNMPPPHFEKTKSSYTTLEERLIALQKKSHTTQISVQELLQGLAGQGKPLLLVLFSIPFIQPLQIPGLSTPFGLLISFLGLRMALGQNIWLPKKLLRRSIPTSHLRKILQKTLRFLQKIHRWIHPRWSKLCYHPLFQKMNGLLIALLGFFLALPLPIPFSNLATAWPIFFLSLGILKSDGLFVILGYLSVLTATLLFTFCFFEIGAFL